MADAIITRFRPGVKGPHPIERIEFIPSGGGVFDVNVNGKTIYSKHQTGRHAEPREVLDAIEALLQS